VLARDAKESEVIDRKSSGSLAKDCERNRRACTNPRKDKRIDKNENEAAEAADVEKPRSRSREKRR
jgi:hypothetical protein